MTNLNIGIICALDIEMHSFLEALTNKKTSSFLNHEFIEGDFNNNHLIITKSGIGKVNAGIICALLIEHYHPNLVINSGIAAAYHRDLQTLDVVIGTKFIYSDFDMTEDVSTNLRYGQVQDLPAYYELSNDLYNKIKSLNIQNVYYGTIASGDQFVTNYEKVDSIVKNHFADLDVYAFDMESCAIAQTCYLFNTEFLIVRSISDVIGSDKPFEYQTFGPAAAKKSFLIVEQLLK